MKSDMKPVLAALLLFATVAGAQRNPNRPAQPQRRPFAGAQQPDSQGRSRAALEGQVQNRIAQMARQRLGLNDAQVQKLQQTNAKFAERRRTLMEQERDIRMSLREELIAGDSSRQRQIGELMDRMVKAQRQRIDLLEEEQRELGAFLTPMQRAKYFGFEEQLRQRLNQMRQEGGRGPMGPAGPGGQPGRGRIRPNGPPPDDMGMDGPPQGRGMQRMVPCDQPGGCPAGPPPAGQRRPIRPGSPDGPPIGPPIVP